MNPQPTGEQAASRESERPTKVTITQRVRRLWRSREQHPSQRAPDAGLKRRLQMFDAHIEHLESVLKGQDADAVGGHESLGELRRHTEPDQIARELNRHERARGS